MFAVINLIHVLNYMACSYRRVDLCITSPYVKTFPI